MVCACSLYCIGGPYRGPGAVISMKQDSGHRLTRRPERAFWGGEDNYPSRLSPSPTLSLCPSRLFCVWNGSFIRTLMQSGIAVIHCSASASGREPSELLL